jgi:hypothetical protein
MAPTMEDRGGACAMVRPLREPHSPPVGPRKGFRARGEASSQKGGGSSDELQLCSVSDVVRYVCVTQSGSPHKPVR